MEKTYSQSMLVVRRYSLTPHDIVEVAADVLKKPTQWRQVIRAARSKHAPERSWMLSKIATAMAKVGLFDKSLQVTQSISDAYFCSSALREIAKAMARAGLLERAFEVVKGIKEPIPCFQALATIAAEMRKAGKIE